MDLLQPLLLKVILARVLLRQVPVIPLHAWFVLEVKCLGYSEPSYLCHIIILLMELLVLHLPRRQLLQYLLYFLLKICEDP